MEPTERETKKDKRRQKKRGDGDVAKGLNGEEKRGKLFF